MAHGVWSVESEIKVIYRAVKPPIRFYMGVGGTAQLVVLGATRLGPVAKRPGVASAAATAVAFMAFFLAGLVAQRGSRGPARVVWALFGSFWAGFGFWVVSVPFSLTAPLPVNSASFPLPAFVYPFPFTYHDFDVSRDLAAVLFMSALSGLTSGGLGLMAEALGSASVGRASSYETGNDTSANEDVSELG
ncbi:MAG: hypothetical protein C4317_02195 [Acidimicrobiia bacterium]